jgi:hypothetical protein
VYTTHGPASFAQFLRGIGVDAEHIAEHPNDAGEEDVVAPPVADAGPQMGLGL